MRALRVARGRPEPPLTLGRLLREHDASDVPVAVEQIVIIVGPWSDWGAFVGAFERQHLQVFEDLS